MVPIRRTIRFIKRKLKSLDNYINPAGVVLMYHRISDVSVEPNWLAVSPKQFEQQLEHIRRKYNPVRLIDLVDAVQNDSIPPYSVAVTFDDGYIDNLTRALPFLESTGVPATVFVVAGHLGSPWEFWWDELESLFALRSQLPSSLTLKIQAQQHSWETISYEQRIKTYLELVNIVKTLPNEVKLDVMGRVREWAGVEQGLREEYRTITDDELKQLTQSEYIDIGAHTMTHPSLPALSLDDQRSEIKQSAHALESIVQQHIDLFAYPYGDLSVETALAVKESGFKAAFTTVDGVVRPGNDMFALNRCDVNDWNIETFEKKMASFFYQSIISS